MNLGAKHRQPRPNIDIINNISGDSCIIYTAFRSKAMTISRKAVTLRVENLAQKTVEIYT
jgi:hypothetical protein